MSACLHPLTGDGLTTMPKRGYLLFVLLAAIFTLGHFVWMPVYYRGTGIYFHFAILEQTLHAPFAQRILLPLMLAPITPTPWAAIYTQAFASIVTMIAALLAGYAWMVSNGSGAGRALVGVSVGAVLVPLWYQSFYGIPYQPLEIVFLVVALLAIRRNRSSWLYPLIVLGTLNRETTGLYIVLLYGLTVRRIDARAVGFTLLFVAVYGIVRLLYPGAGSWQYGITQWNRLLTSGLETAILNHLPLVPLWVLAARSYETAPPALKRIAPLVPINLMLLLIFGNWDEVRLLMPAITLAVIPLILAPREASTVYAGNALNRHILRNGSGSRPCGVS